MEVADQHVVRIHYTLTDDTGDVLDSSSEGEPLTYLHGSGNIIPGLERELSGKRAGDTLQVKVDPADGYGEHREELVQAVPKSAFEGIENIEPGMRFEASGPEGSQVVMVTEVSDDTVTVDANHALAGEILNFDVEIVDVRVAEPEEIEHGHVHDDSDEEH
jgi:FKBP-type peptidyl-prolyl cis-trans isomerase SlyD